MGQIKKSGSQIGAAYAAKFIDFVQSAQGLPVSAKDGSLNIAELVRLTGIPKESFYQNPSLIKTLDQVCACFDVPRWGALRRRDGASARRVQPQGTERVTASHSHLTKAIQKLESQNKTLNAENLELRRHLRLLKLELGRQDMAIETGRRVYSLLENI
ncbi:hypothetical protein GJ699_00150 [Duganella sp. FT80W]|uniref:Uncharacterized protein n=1 Tax=Duganella guangzhouensis TaxID=2666084 RepID=A0A6I2KVJ7_9BURK|nr:hypothetical protein [Duganella guangzhouensis]MRW88394.1 hypothetical protein [Duganella guangzhouensis]